MVFTLILLALCVSSNANPAAPAPPSYPLPPPEGQCPNDWWSYAGDLCIQLDHEPDDFEGALWHCQHWEDHAAEIQEFLLTNEDWSLLLTVERLNYLNTLAKRPFNHKIWLNAIWFQSKWYQIVRYHHRKSYREHIEDGDAVVIPPAEINKLSLEDTHFSDGDNLVYNPENDSVFKRWKGSKSRFSYVCTHRKEHKDLINVDVQVVDENDAPLPAFLWVEDKSGTWLVGNNGEYQFPDVEIGTEFRFTAGFSPIPNELAHKDVIVEPGIGLIKVQLRSGKVKVQFCVIDDNGDPVEGAMVAINGGAPVGTDSAGLIPPTTEAFPCATILNYVVDGPVNPDTNLPIFFQVTGKYVVPKTSNVEVLETIPLTPTPLPVYKDLENCYDGTDPEPDWKIYIIEIVTPGVDEAGCKIACDANPDCDYIATSVILPPADCIPADCPPTEYFCYLASYNGPDPATPIPPTDITATQPKYSYNAGIAASVNEAFEAISKFSSIVAVHYEIFRGLARDKTDCAIRCLVSCEIPELDCDYYIYNEVNQECIMGNIVFSTATGIPPITPDEYLHDDRPLTVINYKKAEIPRIESQLLNGFTAETCPNNLVVIEDSTNLDVNDGLTPCKYAIYNNLGGKVKITLGSTWAQSTPVTVTIGRQVTGVTICSLSSANSECVWSDAVAIVTGFGDGGVPDTDTAVISYTAPPPPPSG